jgi:GNAT superfamily N-acetyltransferase
LSERIQAYVRRNAAAGRDTERIGPFLATFTPSDNHPSVNYAIPGTGARPTPDDVGALVEAYRRRDRLPRIEYLPNLAPAVEPALAAAGFTVEDRLPVMLCERGTEVAQPVPDAVELLAPTTDDEIRGLTVALNAAYGESSLVTDEAVARRRAFVERGGLLVLARDAATGEPVGGGLGDVVDDGLSEFAAFGVVEPYRRRGVAGAITTWLTRAAWAAGATTVFLTAGDESAARVYARAGFRRVDEVLYLRRE